jgi:apolipoprotein N-acyltransferase
MTPGTKDEQREHDLTVHVFSVSAAMVGVCLTVDAVLFVSCCLLAFWSFKTEKPALRRRLRLIVDVIFLIGLTGMACICAIIAYALV